MKKLTPSLIVWKRVICQCIPNMINTKKNKPRNIVVKKKKERKKQTKKIFKTTERKKKQITYNGIIYDS